MALSLAACTNAAPGHRGDSEPEVRYWAVQTTLEFDVVHVLDLVGERWDGLPARVRVEGSTRIVDATDAVGREVSVALDTASETAELRRCSGAVCDTSEAVARMLWSGREDARGYRLLGELDAAAWRDGGVLSVVARDGIVVLALGKQGFAIVDATEPGMPRLLYEERPFDPGEVINDVEMLGRHWLIVASSTRGVRILDLTEPARPSIVVGAFPGGQREVHTLFLDGRVLYAARLGVDGGVDRVDLGRPTSPRLLAAWTLPGCEQVHEVFVHESTLLASCLDDGLLAFDVASSQTPVRLAHWAELGSHSAWLLEDGVTIVATSERFEGPLTVLELDADAGSLSPLAELSLGTAASTHEVRCRGTRCELSYYQEGLLEFEVADPMNLKVTRRFPTWDRSAVTFLQGASAVARDEGLVYVADTTRGLLILERE